MEDEMEKRFEDTSGYFAIAFWFDTAENTACRVQASLSYYNIGI
jgi:hypothetical protein